VDWPSGGGEGNLRSAAILEMEVIVMMLGRALHDDACAFYIQKNGCYTTALEIVTNG